MVSHMDLRVRKSDSPRAEEDKESNDNPYSLMLSENVRLNHLVDIIHPVPSTTNQDFPNQALPPRYMLHQTDSNVHKERRRSRSISNPVANDKGDAGMKAGIYLPQLQSEPQLPR
jgi:hypothetical protein